MKKNYLAPEFIELLAFEDVLVSSDLDNVGQDEASEPYDEESEFELSLD